MNLTTYAHVYQVDDDRIVFYRRVETVMDDQLNYEKCTFNRSDRTITSELVDVLPNGDTKTLEKSVY